VKKLISTGLVLLFVFTLVFSYTFTVNSQTASAAEDECCIFYLCPPESSEYWAWGVMYDFPSGRQCAQLMGSNCDVFCDFP